MNKPVSPADLVTPKVTTGPIVGSRKTYTAPEAAPDLRVPLREIVLDPTAKEPPVPVYDSSGVYTDDKAGIDVEQRPQARARRMGPASAAASRNTTAARSSRSTTATSPASTSRATSRTRRSRCAPSATAAGHAARMGAQAGVITKEMIYVAERENLGRKKMLERAQATLADGESFGAALPAVRHAGIRARRSRARPRHHPVQHQPRRTRADDHRPQLPGEDQRQHRQLGRHLLGRGGSREDGVGDPLGRRHRDGPLHRAATSTTRANGSCAIRRCRSAPCRSIRRWRRWTAIPSSSTGSATRTR